jgi:preprotein translocase subunit SecY
MAKDNSSKGGLSELKKRLFFVLLGILIFRIGAHIPVPGLDPQRLADLFNNQRNSILGLMNMFSGDALRRFTIFALGVMPYISSSIIIQLLTSVIPQLSDLKKEGESGRRKINQYTRYGAVLLAVFQAIGISSWLLESSAVMINVFSFYLVSISTLTAGSIFLMWLGEQMTERGIGNGISLLIFAGIASRFPAAVAQVLEQVRQGEMQVITMLLLLAVVIVVTGVVVFIESAQRRIPIHYAKRQIGRTVYAAQSSYLPFKINMSGVIPAIFASSIMMFPATIAQWFGSIKGMGWLREVGFALQIGQPLYLILFTIAIVFFCFFYTAMVFNPKETAENLKKAGAFITGVRPGENTAEYIDSIMTRLTFLGAIYVTLICLLPQFLIMSWNVPFYFGGTSLLIVVVVLMDFTAQIQAHLMSRQYDSLLKKSKLQAGFKK